MKFFKKTDVIIILVLIVLSTLGFFGYKYFFAKKTAIAEIYYKTELVKVIDLTTATDKTFTVPENKNVVFKTFSDGSICFYKSDCPDKICIHSGKLSIPGQSAACLPNKLFIRIVSKDGYSNDDIDIVVGQ